MSTRRVEESTLGLLSLEAMKEVSQELDEISLWAWANAAMEEPKRAVAAFRQRLGLTE